MSEIAAIYERIANFDLGGIKSRNLPDIQLLVQQGDCPVRLLMPSTRGEQSFVLVGSTQKILWTIRDLCLWAPISEGQGIELFAQPMQDYVVAYLAAIKALYGGAVTSQANITSATFQAGPIIWGETSFWAVDTQLSVEEYA